MPKSASEAPAFAQIMDLAGKVVRAFIENVSLVQRKPNPYVVGQSWSVGASL